MTHPTGAPTEPTEEEVAAYDFRAIIEEASKEFFRMTRERHEMGQAKYGPIKFMEVNTLEEALEEVADLANYAMYTYWKLWLLNTQLQKITGEGNENIPTPLGPKSFMSNGGN